jgi:hypothetical protein
MNHCHPRNIARACLVAAALALVSWSCATEANDPLLVSSSSETTAAQPGTDPTETTAPTVAQEQAFSVGDRVGLGEWEVIVHGVTDPYDDGDEFFVPEPGNRWVLVDAELFYNGTEPEIVSTPLCFEVQDAENRVHTETFVDNPIGIMDGDIAPGAGRRGGMVYEVPEAATNLRLNFNCDLLATGSATINLS